MYKITFVVFIATLAVSHGFGIREVLDYLLGGHGYGNYPSGPGYYPGQYGNGHYGQGQYGQGNYGPGHYGPPGPPGAHPGCPLCDSSVYSYCSYKEKHDSCCCSGPLHSYNCGKYDCTFLYANSCQEYELITRCCCVDLYKNNQQDVPVVA